MSKPVTTVSSRPVYSTRYFGEEHTGPDPSPAAIQRVVDVLRRQQNDLFTAVLTGEPLRQEKVVRGEVVEDPALPAPGDT